MKKKIIAIVFAAVLAVSLSVTAFAAPLGRGANQNYSGLGLGLGICGGGYALMCDEAGNFLDREAFEAKLDKAISDGLIAPEFRTAMLERYDYCASNGFGGMGVRNGGRGCCGGRGYVTTP